jgi:cephalosporin-C deacetylase-like acetyl esterase
VYRTTARAILVVPLFAITASFAAEREALNTDRGDRMIAEYFLRQTAELRDACLADVQTLADWEACRGEYRRQLLEMLGLDPLPERTDLQAQVTGSVAHDGITVEKIQFQSRPGLYVTGDLYLPADSPKPAPAVLYVCGHGPSKQDGVSFGNKVTYQHHGAWFARHGYACLTIDTLQMGEIEGIHHGTYRYDMWWWLNRGYTPAGVEAWNCVRALDYLQSRPEVDPDRIGVTGRSGGGAYSWWIAAIDERIKAAVPVAGITDLENHVVDGCVEGHCDCMFMVNTYRWDYPLVAALVAPRPLLLSNTDRDRIFPLDGVVRTFNKVRKIYRLYEAEENLGLHVTAGPHKDTQQLRVGAFHWLNRHLKRDESLIDKPAVKFFEPQELKVFADLPADQRNTEIHETFVATQEVASAPNLSAEWEHMRDAWKATLLAKSFRGWPREPPEVEIEPVFSIQREGVHFEAVDFTSQQAIRLRLFLVRRADLDGPDAVVLDVLNDSGWIDFLTTMTPVFADQLRDETLPPADGDAFAKLQERLSEFDGVLAYVAPRGIGSTAWDQSTKKQTQHRRRFYLLGQTLDGMRIWDVRRAIQTLRCLPTTRDVSVELRGSGIAAGLATYAAIFEPDIAKLDLVNPPATHRDGPYLLNVRRIFDLPQAVALAAENSRVVIRAEDAGDWEYPQAVARQLEWGGERLRIENE